MGPTRQGGNTTTARSLQDGSPSPRSQPAPARGLIPTVGSPHGCSPLPKALCLGTRLLHSDTSSPWVPCWGSKESWQPPAPAQPSGTGPCGPYCTHPAASSCTEGGSRLAAPHPSPAQLPGGDAGSRQTSLTQHNRNSYNFKNMRVCDSGCWGCFN